MSNLRFSQLMIALACAALPTTFTLAEDTDIYSVGSNTATNPNVLIILDNSANWNANNQNWPTTSTCTAQCKQGKAELNALRTVIGELDASVNVGLMMFTSGATDGAYPRYHIRPMTNSNKTAFQQLLGDPAGCTDSTNSLTQTPNCIYQNFNKSESSGGEMTNSASTRYSAGFFSAYKYFGGYTSPAHATDDVAGTPTDTTHFGTLRYTNGRYLGDPAAYTDAGQTRYNPAISETNSCGKNYIIFVGNGYPSQDLAASVLTGVGGDATPVSVPDFNTTTGVSRTLLGTGTYASQAACETAAAATYGDSYASYSCENPTVATSNTTLGTTSCGQYGSQAACETAAATLYPGYSSYQCSVLSSCTGSASLGTSTCGQFSSVSDCEANADEIYPGYSSYSCTLSSSTCTATTTTLATTNCGEYNNSSSCQTAAASRYPGYASYACTSAGSCSTNLGQTSCYSSASACQSSVLAINSGYSSVTCASGTSCAAATATVCAASNAYNAQADCNAAAPGILGATYASYTCTRGGNCAAGKTWTISGANQSYTATGSGTRWTMTGTNPAGSRYDITGTGGGSTYTMVGQNSSTSWSIYGEKTVISATPTGTYTGTSSNYADEWSKFMYQTDVSAASGQQNVRTYAIDVFKDQQDADQTKLLMSMAQQGGGKYFTATDEESLKNAFRKIFSEIQSVNSVFASSSLPVSVNTQGTYLNQVFIGMFRPDGGAKPRWAGNLKQYQFDIDPATSSLLLVDKNGDAALSATTGFISTCANSMWSSDTGAYWSFAGASSQGGCTAETSNFPSSGSSSAYSDAPDGDVVEKGGAAQKLRGVLSTAGSLTSSATRYQVCGAGQSPSNAACRKLLTCNHATCSDNNPSLVEFSTSNAGTGSANPSLTAASLGAVDDTERNALINWVRGQDVDDENTNANVNEVRPSVHGAVVHSQPAVIDYGGDVGVYAFYGADDGVFHAVDGGKTDSEGVEAWGFIAPETYSQLKRYRDNEPYVDFPQVNMSISPTPQPKSYFFDGSVGVYQKNSTVWIYPSMRRGGRAIYAFDVSTPTSPTLKWRKGCFTSDTGNDGNCSAGWTGIGQTWSKPQVGFLSGYVNASNQPKPVLVFGGGYDTCEDTNSQTRCTSTPRKGANIWFVDADTGAIIRTYPTNYSVPGDVFLSKDANGNIIYVHAVDTGGYVYRINVASTDGYTFTNWSANTAASDIDIAYLSEAGQQRKFLYGPDVAQYPGFRAVMVGTGDREHPLAGDYACGNFSATSGQYVTNQFFMIKDVVSSYPDTLTSPSDLTDVSTSLHGETAIGSLGWRFNLNQCEQVVNKALSIGGKVFFGTNQPANVATNSCSTNLGIARGYSVDILNAAAPCDDCTRSTTYQGGGMPPSPVAGVVEVDGEKVVFLLGGQESTADTVCSGEGCSALGGTEVNINPASARYRAFWYVEKD